MTLPLLAAVFVPECIQAKLPCALLPACSLPLTLSLLSHSSSLEFSCPALLEAEATTV